MDDLIFMKPYLRETPWGGDKLKKFFGYDIPSDKTGEAWTVSAVGEAGLKSTDNREGFEYPGESVVSGGIYDGAPLSFLWENHRELFGHMNAPEFPLLVKFLDACEDLSIQVHPDDAYARKYENGASGKKECWYMVDCAEDADLAIGHTADCKETLEQMILENRWDELITSVRIKKGDFFYIPSGIVHAIHKNTLVLEIEQSSNLTYRLYDYGRLYKGAPRKLHTQKALDVITCPQRNLGDYKTPSWPDMAYYKEPLSRSKRETLLANSSFYLEKWVINSVLDIKQPLPFMVICVTEGSGSVNDRNIKAGSCFIATSKCKMMHFEGNMTCICAGAYTD